MTTYYCGPGGLDANSGLTWALRKLTLNGIENIPVAAGDTAWIGPGVYREMLTLDVSGAAGSPITYIGDVSGEHTDGIGGVVRVTGSDNDQTATRAYCITCAAQRNYRTFRGFTLDTTTTVTIYGGATAGTNWIIEDCTFQGIQTTGSYISVLGANQANWIIRRCVFFGNSSSSASVSFVHASAIDNVSHVVENCVFMCNGYGVRSSRVGGISIRNCVFLWGTASGSVRTDAALTVGQTITVYDSIFYGCSLCIRAFALGEIIEDYNSLSYYTTDRTNVAVGANSNTYPPLFDLGILHAGASQVSGFRFPTPLFGTLSQWSQVRALSDAGAATEDMLGLTRPVTAGKRSLGAVQYVNMARDTTTVHAGTASKKLADAGRDQIYVPTTNVSTVFSVYVYREANYAGVNPQMIIKQPGQADTVVTDAGAAGAWNQLTTTLTPAATPGYVVIELVSNNTAAAGAYGVYFDDLTVT